MPRTEQIETTDGNNNGQQPLYSPGSHFFIAKEGMKSDNALEPGLAHSSWDETVYAGAARR